MLDVWNLQTFDDELLDALQSNEQTLIGYFLREAEYAEERERSSHRNVFPGSNRFSGDYHSLLEWLAQLLEFKVFRGWHYTRLTDQEVSGFQLRGVQLSTRETFMDRLKQVVQGGALTEREAKRLFDKSVMLSYQHEFRANRFWVTSNPVCHVYGGVDRLLRYWGGEAASFWQDDDDMLAMLEQIGKPRILEIAMQIREVGKADVAAESIVDTFVRERGLRGRIDGFDACTRKPLPPQSVLMIHTEGEPSYSTFATGVPGRSN